MLRRSLSGMRMALNMPLSAFSGVGLRVSRDGSSTSSSRTKTPGSAYRSASRASPNRPTRNGRSWGRALALPLLVQDEAGIRELSRGWAGCVSARLRPRRRRALGLEEAEADDFIQACNGTRRRGDAGASRRARDHRAQLGRELIDALRATVRPNADSKRYYRPARRFHAETSALRKLLNRFEDSSRGWTRLVIILDARLDKTISTAVLALFPCLFSSAAGRERNNIVSYVGPVIVPLLFATFHDAPLCFMRDARCRQRTSHTVLIVIAFRQAG